MSRTHGLPSTYTGGGCRCDDCTAAYSVYRRARRKAHAARLAADPTLVPHGVASTYKESGCRCDACLAAARQMDREYRARRAQWRRRLREAAS